MHASIARAAGIGSVLAILIEGLIFGISRSIRVEFCDTRRIVPGARIAHREPNLRNIRHSIGLEQILRRGLGTCADALARTDRHRKVVTARGIRPVIPLSVSIAQVTQQESGIESSIWIHVIPGGVFIPPAEPRIDHLVDVVTGRLAM